MKYNIVKVYTEKLDILSFQKFVEDNTELSLLVNFNTSLQKTDVENELLLKIEYTLNASNAPVSLNWTGVAILNFEEHFTDKLNSASFLENDIIKDFIDSSIDHFSSLLGGALPHISDITKGKNDN